MNQYFKRAGVIAAALIFSVLAGCTTMSTVSPTQVAAVTAGDQGAIVFVGGSGFTYTFTNVETGQTYDLRTDNTYEVLPGVTAVPPGRYRLTGAGSMFAPLLEKWFADFEVGRGEVLYLGSFQRNSVEVYRAVSQGEKVMSIVRMDIYPPGGRLYYTYSIDDEWTDRTRKYMQDEYPGLAAVMVDRPLQAIVDRDAFEEVVTTAYAPRNGVAPDGYEAEMRARIAINALIARSRRGAP